MQVFFSKFSKIFSSVVNYLLSLLSFLTGSQKLSQKVKNRMSQPLNGIRKEPIKIFIHSAGLNTAISWIAYGMLSAPNTTVRLAKKQNTMSY